MSNIHLSPIEVKLVHSDDWKSLLKNAWLYSRPFLKESELDYNQILKIDTPVSEIPGVVLELYVPILFREILCNLRDHTLWSQTSRNINLIDKWDIIDSSSSSDKSKIMELHDKLLEASKTEDQDQFRQTIPLGSMTGLTARFSIRTLFKIIKYFDHLSSTYPTISVAANEFSTGLKNVVSALDINLEEVNPHIKMQDLIPVLKDVTDYPSAIHSDNHTVVKVQIPVSLRAQLIRHRVISVVDNLLDFIEHENVWALPISTEMVVEISASNSIWKSIVGKRIGWIAQADLWSSITDLFTKSGNIEDFMMDLSEGYPYEGDNWERIKGTDPGVPDPLHVLVLTDQEFNQWITSDMIQRMYKYVIDTNRPTEYWNKIIDKVQDRFNAQLIDKRF